MIFRILDYSQTLVILSDATWYKKLMNPVFGHPEVKPLLSQIKLAISDPEYVYTSLYDTRSKLLARKIVRGEFASYFLVVVVKYVKEMHETVGYVSTVMIQRKLPKTSKLIWERKASI
ncbi:hypothetical protein HYW54_04850 [Candidatus Gottesmanbacteria bacterium]|nr:hypothetical protein [Candidatus Gottesmanbacteria bacterium]